MALHRVDSPALAYTFITNDVGQDRYGIFVAFFATTEAAETGTHPLYVVPFIDWPKQSWFCISLSFKKIFQQQQPGTTWVAGLDGGIGGKEGMGVELGIGVTMGRRPPAFNTNNP